MSMKTVASLLCDNGGVCLLLAVFLTSNISTGDSSLTDNVKISRNGNTTIPETTTPQGTVQGINMETRYNRTVFGFMGIPYAQPPVGDLRFKAPTAAGAWDGTLNASSDSEPCPQFSDAGVVIGSEDCLYLNVYTPQLPESDNSTLLPVMVFIVGGGFKTEIISPERYGPDFLLDKDVILVIPNFRVGVLGYLTTADEVAPGNYGLKDIVCALEWVENNIQYFGGDPNQVTLFGGSSGAMSVHLLTLSDLTRGLFHRYITQSGTGLLYELEQSAEVHANRAIQLAEYLGCPTNTSTLLVNCLRGLAVTQLVDTNSIFYVWKTMSGTIWLPTYDPDVEGALFTDTPRNLMAAGKISDVPWIAHVSRDEGLAVTIQFYEDPEYFEEFLENIDLVLPLMLGYGNVADDVSAYTAALKSFYLNDLTANRSVLLANLTQMASDALYVYPSYTAMQKTLVLAESPQYYDCFSYRGTFSFSYFYSGTTNYTGVVHADEMIYLFGHQGERLGPSGDEFNEDDWLMVDKMVQLWTSFATNGTPTTLDSENVTWEPYSSLNNYLRIGNGSDTGLGMEYDLYLERMQFWDQLSSARVTSAGSRYNLLHINLLRILSIAICLCLLPHNL